jgi:hypothetical protein
MATTTPNFGWPVPTSTDLVKDGAVAIEGLGDAIDASLLDLKGGTTNQVLAKNSNTDMDFKWVSDATGMTNPMTTTGDTIYSSSGSTPARLGIGSTGQVLTVAGGIPSWATPATSGFVGCALYRSGAKTIANATATLIDFDAERIDTNGFHDNVTNNTRITIPTGYAGKYLVTWQLGFNFNATGYREIELLINGSQFPQSYNLITSTGYTTQSAALVYPFSVGDYIQIRATQTSGGNLDSGATQAFLSAVYLGA